MNIAITGGTGFVGRHIARRLHAQGHRLLLLARGFDHTDTAVRTLPNSRFLASDLGNSAALACAFTGCDAVVHCAGINRELGESTFERVHVQATRNVTEAARLAGVKKLVLISFLRARPDCGSAYHESKWAAEEIVRGSVLDYTILKCGVIYGPGDHMLNHLSGAFHTFPVFAYVGIADKPVRPIAVDDLAQIVTACVLDGALPRATVAVLGPTSLTLREAVRMVARETGRSPWAFPLPVWFHYLWAYACETLMITPLVSRAQVRMLTEGLAEPAPPCPLVPESLAPRIPFCAEQIRKRLPPPRRFGWSDLRPCRARSRCLTHKHRVFFEMP